MGRVWAVVVIFAAAFALLSVGKGVGYLKVLAAPRLRAEDLKTSPVSVDDQRTKLVQFAHGICQSFDACAQSTHTEDHFLIGDQCRRTAEEISKIQIPSQLPVSVIENLALYRQSMINSALNIANKWYTEPKDGGRFWARVVNWEIDTCGADSIPQKVYRLYGIDQMAQVKIVTCDEIEVLSRVRALKSLD